MGAKILHRCGVREWPSGRRIRRRCRRIAAASTQPILLLAYSVLIDPVLPSEDTRPLGHKSSPAIGSCGCRAATGQVFLKPWPIPRARALSPASASSILGLVSQRTRARIQSRGPCWRNAKGRTARRCRARPADEARPPGPESGQL